MRHPKRRANMLYKLRRRGILCNTKERCNTSPTMRIQSTTHKYQGCAESFTSTFNSSSHDGLNVPLNLKPSFINNSISLHYD